jgi:hypothetical protein
MAFASLGSFASILAALSCCFPLAPFIAAAGVAGGSAFLVSVRPYLLVLSVLLIAYGFYQGYRARQCNCQPSPLSTMLLWISALILFVSVFFPQALAGLLAG